MLIHPRFSQPDNSESWDDAGKQRKNGTYLSEKRIWDFKEHLLSMTGKTDAFLLSGKDIMGGVTNVSTTTE